MAYSLRWLKSKMAGKEWVSSSYHGDKSLVKSVNIKADQGSQNKVGTMARSLKAYT